MQPEDEIKRLIHESEITSGPGADARILGDALDRLDKRRPAADQGPRPGLWRLMMTSKTGKLAVAAAVVIAVLLGMQFFGGPFGSTVTWADVIEPIFNADTAVLDIIVGAETDDTPVIHDMVMGSRIRRTISNVDGVVSVIDLETGRILSLTEEKLEAEYIDLEGLPSIPNYMDQLRNVITMLQDSPHFDVEELGEHQIDGRALLGFRATHPKVEITIWADRDTALPVRIEQSAGQMLVICKNLQFDVPMDDALFSMQVPDGYAVKEHQLDLLGSTEEDFIEGLRIRAKILGDGRLPDDVSVEAYLKQAGEMVEKFEALDLSDEEETELGMKLGKHLLFIRFFSIQSEGQWTYRGQGVTLGDAETPIFWYQPKDSETYRVIYGDLRVEDVAPEELPEPPDSGAALAAGAGAPQPSQSGFVGSQEDYWLFLADGRVRVEAHLTLSKVPTDASLLPMRLPYPKVPLETVILDRRPLTFHETGPGTYTVELPAETPPTDETSIVCQWHLSMADLQEVDYGYRARLRALIPVVSYKLKVGLDADSGLELTEPLKSHLQPSQPWAVPFSWADADEPTVMFGSCGITLQQRN